jgi:uncharacterized protein (DUF58 family)
MPARRFFLLLGGSTVLVTAGLLAPWLAALTLVLDALLLGAFWLDLRRARALRLEARRSWPPLLFQGLPAELELDLESPDAPFELVVREALHPTLAVQPERWRLRLAGRARRSFALLPQRRGEIAAGPLTARLLGPWGLAWSQRELLPAEVRRVYPQVRWQGRTGQLLALAQRHELGAVPLGSAGRGSEVYALRDYQPGDGLGRVHWKATARHGRPVAREDTWESGARLVILLDAGRAMAGNAERRAGGAARPEVERTKLDASLAASLALLRLAAGRGDRVTLVAFDERLARVVRAGSAPAEIRRAHAALFDLEARFVEPAFDLAAREVERLEPRRAIVVLFTSVTDLAAAEMLGAAVERLARRHRTLLVNLEDPELAALASEAPADAAAAFAQVAALEIQLGNRRLVGSLRRTRARVVSAPADRLTLAGLEAYLGELGEGAGVGGLAVPARARRQ